MASSEGSASEVVAVDQLTAAEQAALTGGIDLWHTAALERLGVPSLRVTDGPAGARGTQFGGERSLLLPCPTAMASTWSTELVARVGQVLAAEVRRKGAVVLLAPTVNLQRDPRGGRCFECFSEDPQLSAELAVAYVDGVQGAGVGCAVKHFAANDQEQDRMTVSVEVDDRTLRELYLLPFEAAVRRAGAWMVMAAYNRLGGTYCSAHRDLLTGILREEWGFDGVVVSDWFGTHATEAVAAGLDLEMPGPARHLGPRLADAEGALAEARARAADRVLRLAARAAAGVEGEAASPPDGPALAREVAAAGVVVLQNDGTLPLRDLRRLAVLGPRAARTHLQGGGSAHVDPDRSVPILDGLVERAARAGIEVVHEPGVVHRPRAVLGEAELRVPGTDEPGVRCTEQPADGGEPTVRTLTETRVVRLTSAPEGPPPACTYRLEADLVVDRTGTWTFALTTVEPARATIDGVEVVANDRPRPGGSFFGAGDAPVEGTVVLTAGRRHALVLELESAPQGSVAITGVELAAEPPPDPDAPDRAVVAAYEADAAVVVVGGPVDTEGADRPGIDLPEDQVALIRKVAEVNDRTVVVLNVGAPTTTPWRHDVAAVACAWYPGQEGGHAVADVLFGDVDATGRLAATWFERLEDWPAVHHPQADGTLRYGEGRLMGYRHADAHGVEPAFPFGHGLGYTTFAYGPASAALDDAGGVSVEVPVTNSGTRPGTEVVQLYVAPDQRAAGDPVQQLRGFARVTVAPGATGTARVSLPPRAFAGWDPDAGAWRVAGGRYELRVGSSSRDLRATAVVELPARTLDPEALP